MAPSHGLAICALVWLAQGLANILSKDIEVMVHAYLLSYLLESCVCLEVW